MCFFATRILFVVVAVFSLGACTPYTNTPSRGLDSLLAMELSPDRTYNLEIGDRVEGLLRNAKHLTVVGVISQTVLGENKNMWVRGGTDPITVRTSMTRDSESGKHSLVTLVYDKDLVLIRGFFLSNGVVQEYFRQNDGSGTVVKYDSPFYHGTDNPLMKHDIDCLIGVHTISWIGIPAKNDLPYLALDRAYKIRERVVSGERVEDSLEFGRWCYVFSQRFPRVGEAVLEHVEYIDMKSGLTCRWDTVQEGVSRERRYYIINTDPVPGGLQFLWDTHVQVTAKEK